MLSLKVETQASVPTSHVYSDWALGSSLGSSLETFGSALSASLEVVDAQPKRVPCEELNPHNNSVPFTVGLAQMAAYSPVEDKIYVNEAENMFALFDGHGGGITILEKKWCERPILI